MKTMQSETRQTGNAAARRWLASLLIGGSAELSSRFARACRAIAALSRPRRRRLQHRLSLTLTSAALLLALAGPTALLQPAAHAGGDAAAVTIVVVDGEVDNVTNGKCGLMEAIINARATRAGQMRPDCTGGNLNGPDTVSLPLGGYFIIESPHNAQFGLTGLPVITSEVIIDGNGSTIYRSAAADAFRLLAVDDVGELTLRNTILGNGSSYGSGGAILNKNVLTIQASEIRDSRVSGPEYDGAGGAIYAEPGTTTTIRNSLITDNSAWCYYCSGGGVAGAGDLTIIDSTITGNWAAAGGGINVLAGGTALITGSRIALNTATEEYAGIGGGMTVAGVAVIRNSTIELNKALGGLDYGGYGGGVFVGYRGTATISGSTIVGNLVTSGGQYGPSAPWDGPGYGGGVFVSGEADISNSTISGNEANRGGGLYNGGTLTLTHTTITDNRGIQQVDTYQGYEVVQPGFGGGMVIGRYGCAVTTLVGTIISGNTADDGVPEVLVRAVEGCSHVLAVDAFNLFGHSGESGLVGLVPGPSDLVPMVGIEAILEPLGDNGGPTLTHALVLGSPALDRSPNAVCAAAPINSIDQRGQLRNANALGPVTDHDCDAGSFERAPLRVLLPVIPIP